MTLYEAIEMLVSKYTYAQAQDWIVNPLAWALYQTWRAVDEKAERKEYIVKEPKDPVLAIETYTSFYGEPIKELIRCRDCKYYNRANDRCEEPYSTAHNLVDGSDYCSRAERKSND